MITTRLTTRYALLALAATLAACARNAPPAPVIVHSAPQTAPAAPSNETFAPQPPVFGAPVAGAGADSVTALPGESLFALSRRANVAMRSLIDANNLQPPYALTAGQRLNLPRARTYQVQSGDTLPGIARRFGLGMNELVRVNAVPPPYALQAGQVLTLPTDAIIPPSMAAAVASAPAPSAAVSAPAVAEPIVPSAPRSSIEATALPPPPRAAAPSVASAPTPPAAPAAAIEAPAEPALAAVRPPRPEPPAASTSIPGLPPSQRAAPADEGPAPPKGSRAFAWPLRGPVISDFGNKPGGLQNDGINISAPRGASIRAADNGVVLYAGNELRGYGNLLLVRHADGWVTAYAHADELLVKRGEQVRRGQIIAKVGNSGGVNVPQLHFEVRKGSRPFNPRDFLGA